MSVDVPICNMVCAAHVWDVKNFPLDSAALSLRKHRENEFWQWSSSESEEPSRKRDLGMEFHLSTIPCDKPNTGNCGVQGGGPSPLMSIYVQCHPLFSRIGLGH